jgi:hypothetical protein
MNPQGYEQSKGQRTVHLASGKTIHGTYLPSFAGIDN